ADVAIVFVNADSGEEYITVDDNMGDRKNMTLWHNGENLINAVSAANKNTIVVIHSPGAIVPDASNWQDKVNAILYALMPGQETGNAIADVLFGIVNPSARLPFTVAKKVSDYSTLVVKDFPDQNNQVLNYSEGLLIDYRWFDAKNIEPLYAFGHGLSYSSFAYSNIQINNKGNGQVPVTVTVSISNSGAYDGHEVPQLYLGYPAAANEPVRVLRGFERVFVKAGQSTQVTFNLRKEDVSYYDAAAKKWDVVKGNFNVWVGASSRDLRLSGSFTL
ncbi:hypothetical protein HDU76_012301, partial [Blyttiomyces sp. JEL0837]